MCTPVGHSIIGLAVGLAAGLPRGGPAEFGRAIIHYRWPLIAAVAMANAPDLDYLPGLLSGDLNAFHHGYTHTLGWTVLAGLGVWWLTWRRLPLSAARSFVLIFAALASHLAADILTADGAAPYGIMALWPITDARCIATHTLFLAPEKETWSALWQWHNLRVAAVDAAWAALPVALVLAVRWVPRHPG